MTLGELITCLLEIDIEHPESHDDEVFLVEDEDDPGHFWLIVGEGEYQL